MKKVLDMNPFFGLSWEDEDGQKYFKGEGLSEAESAKLDEYFNLFQDQRFKRGRSIELAQMAINGQAIPQGWSPSTDKL